MARSADLFERRPRIITTPFGAYHDKVVKTYYTHSRVDGSRKCQTTVEYHTEDSRTDSLPLGKIPDRHDRNLADHFIMRVGDSVIPLFSGKLLLPVYLPHMFSPMWIAKFSESLEGNRSESQGVVAIGNNFISERFTASDQLSDLEYSGRTVSFDNVHLHIGWIGSASEHIARRLPEKDIVGTVYKSYEGDQSFGLHTDDTPGAMAQLEGEKRWTIGDSGEEFTLKPGDVLLLPASIKHDVKTHGNSTHLVFSAVKPALIAA